MSKAVLSAVVRALDLCVIECLPIVPPFDVGRASPTDSGPVPGPRARHSLLRTLTPAPPWLSSVFEAMSDDARTALRGAVPFLEHYLQQAEAVWHEGHGASNASEPFVISYDGADILLRAVAITQHEHRLLILQRMSGDADVRPAFQRAREQKLDYERLVQKAGKVHEPAAAVDRDVKALTAAALPSEQHTLLESLARANTEMQKVLAALPAAPSRHRRQARTK